MDEISPAPPVEITVRATTDRHCGRRQRAAQT
jgi:hypothetical protein